MRRFEREVQGRRRFWEIDQRGTEVHVHTGELGRKGRTRVRPFSTAEDAASELNLAIHTMVDAGWSEVRVERETPPPDEVHAGVLADPDDPGGYLVLGDVLQGEGDPRGELIGVQAARLDAPDDPVLKRREDELMALHDTRFLGPLPMLEWPWVVDWFCGYLRSLSLHAEGYGGEAAAVIDSLAETGSLDFLRTLDIRGAPQFDAIVNALARRSWHVLTELALGGPGTDGELYESIGALLAWAPQLQRLEIRVQDVTVGALTHPTLAELELRVLHGDGLHTLDLKGLAALRRVTLSADLGWFADRRALVEAVDVPLDRLQLMEGAATEYLAGIRKREAPLGTLVLGPVANAPLLVDRLAQVKDALAGIPIELVGVEVSDDDLQRLAPLSIETELPDVAVRRDRLYVSPRQESWRVFHRKGRFWAIIRDEAVIRVRYGKIGSAGTTKETVFRLVERAATQYRRRVREKRAQSWVEAPGATLD